MNLASSDSVGQPWADAAFGLGAWFAVVLAAVVVAGALLSLWSLWRTRRLPAGHGTTARQDSNPDK